MVWMTAHRVAWHRIRGGTEDIFVGVLGVEDRRGQKNGEWISLVVQVSTRIRAKFEGVEIAEVEVYSGSTRQTITNDFEEGRASY